MEPRQDTEGTETHTAKSKKAFCKDYVRYDFNYITFWERQNYRHKISVVAWGSTGGNEEEREK